MANGAYGRLQDADFSDPPGCENAESEPWVWLALVQPQNQSNQLKFPAWQTGKYQFAKHRGGRDGV